MANPDLEQQELESLAAWWESSPQKQRDLDRFLEIVRKHDTGDGLPRAHFNGTTITLPAWEVELLRELQEIYADPDTARRIVTLLLREVGVYPKPTPGPSGNC